MGGHQHPARGRALGLHLGRQPLERSQALRTIDDGGARIVDEYCVLTGIGRSGQAQLSGCLCPNLDDDVSARMAEAGDDVGQRFRDAIESIPNDFAILSADGSIVLCNSAYAEIYDEDPRGLALRTRVDRSQAFLRRVRSDPCGGSGCSASRTIP